jgi:hypothetical protein
VTGKVMLLFYPKLTRNPYKGLQRGRAKASLLVPEFLELVMIAWSHRGAEAFVTYTNFRYHNGKEWSQWEDVHLIFADKLMQALNELLKKPNSPMFVSLEKGKEGWSGFPQY